jgi:hypothetical protein
MALVNLVTIAMGFTLTILALVVVEDLRAGDEAFMSNDEDYLQGVCEGTLDNEGASK